MHRDADWGDSVPHLTQTAWHREGELVVIEGRLYEQGHASGHENNCLIDTLRQSLGIEADASWVREQLECRFHRDAVIGEAVVRCGAFLELQHHWRDTIELLFEADQSGKVKCCRESFKITCVDLRYMGHGDVVGYGPHHLYIARVGANHFIPLILCER